jgi:DNA repair photolyase
MMVYETALKGGITRSNEFERKKLAAFAVNVGTKCGHGCHYCSSGASLRMNPSFAEAGESPFTGGYAIVDPDTPERVARDAKRIRNRGVVQLCTTVDAWSPEAQEHGLGRRCLEAILAEPGWAVRILTKNAAVANEFDLIQKHADRVLVSLSLTANADKADVLSVVEPHASPITERMAVLEEAHRLGLRTYGMLCPLLPGISDAPKQVDALIRFVTQCGAEEIFVEPVNPRANCLSLTQEALEEAGYLAEAKAVESIRTRKVWSMYVCNLIANVQRSIREHSDVERLRLLLYPSGLTPAREEDIREDEAGIVWLGKK